MTSPKLLLASTSVHRRHLLQRLPVAFACCDPRLDEAPYQLRQLSPSDLALSLARGKAEAVATAHPAAVVIGGDQVCAAGPVILSKPGTPENAHRQLQQLSGSVHQLITAVCVCSAGRREEFVVTASLSMRSLTDDEIRRYVQHDAPLDCAGSYRIEGAGISLFEQIECEDFTAIVGLPLLKLSAALRTCGYAVP